MSCSIETQQLSKRYQYHWVIRDLSVRFQSGTIWGISGSNGAGKSTLVKMLSGYLSPTLGSLRWQIGEKQLPSSAVYSHVSWAAPYTSLTAEFTLKEMFAFHTQWKRLRVPLSFREFEQLIELKGHADKPLQYHSSGMLQKIQLALAILSDSQFLFLDEPTSFLDDGARDWFVRLLHAHHTDRLVIIASNDAFDLGQCGDILSLASLS